MTKTEFIQKYNLGEYINNMSKDLDFVIENAINEVLPTHDKIIYASREYEKISGFHNLPHHDFINGANYILAQIIKNKKK